MCYTIEQTQAKAFYNQLLSVRHVGRSTHILMCAISARYARCQSAASTSTHANQNTILF